MNIITRKIALPDGREITLETGKLAKQADGAVMVTLGKTMLLATVCAAKDAVPGTDFMPLQVEYREKYAAFGRYPGGFTKREGKPSDYEILTCRLVDRALRPLFPDNYHAEVYVNIIMFSADGVDMPDALAGLAASAALAVSDIPFNGPISEVRVARVDGEYVIDPTFEQLERADMDIMVGATYDNIMMVEGEMKEVSEADLLGAMKAAHEAIKPMCLVQNEMAEAAGKTVKREYCHEDNDEDLRAEVKAACYDKAYAISQEGNRDKHAREDAFTQICEDFKAAYAEAHTDLTEDELAEKNALIDRYYHDVERDAMRRCVLDEGKRLDGRKTTDIRPIWWGELFLRVGEEEVALLLQGYEVDVSVRNFHTQHGYAYALAGNGCSDGLCHAFGKQRQRNILLIAEVEEVIDFVLGDAKGVALLKGVDIKESEVMFVLRNFVAGNLPCNDS